MIITTMKRLLGINGLLLLSAIAIFTSCGSKKSSNLVSSKTGWGFNDPGYGGFDVPLYEGQYIGPGLSFVEGGIGKSSLYTAKKGFAVFPSNTFGTIS